MNITLILFLIGILLRHGRFLAEYFSKDSPNETRRVKTPVNSTVNYDKFVNSKGSRLNAAIMSNEAWSWGSTKWGKETGKLGLPHTLPSSTVYSCWRWLNSRMKNGTAIPSDLPSKLESKMIGKDRLWDVCLWIHLIGQAITGSSSERLGHKPNQPNGKHGNPGKWRCYSLNIYTSDGEQSRVSLTYLWNSRDGGKIVEQANARGNALDTRWGRQALWFSTSRVSGAHNVSLNSIGRTEVPSVLSGGRYKIRDLQNQILTVRSNSKKMSGGRYTASLTNTSSIQEQVIGKQKELVELAKLKGVYDKSVLDRQILLVRSRLFRAHAAWIISRKGGSQTSGVDNVVFDKENREESLRELEEQLRQIIYHPKKYVADPIRRVWIPKPGKKEKRPLGIPTVKDRALQALVNLVLLPLVELTSDPNSYGFRPYRDCKMALAAVRSHLKSFDVEKRIANIRIKKGGDDDIGGRFMTANQDKWIFDADIKGFFDNINHDWIMDNIFLHEDLKKILRQWLKARIFDEGIYTDPLSGTPQGGIISPTLANFTLNGLEKTVKESIQGITKNKEQIIIIKMKGKKDKLERVRLALPVHVIRYADDFIIITRSKNLLQKYISPLLDKFLKERGLWLSPQKTKQYSLRQPGAQLDFLGYTFKYEEKWSSKRSMRYTRKISWGISLYPNREKVIAFIRKLRKEFRDSQNSSAIELISKINPIIRGWANYYNLDNSSRYRTMVREALYRLAWKWMIKKHPTLGKIGLAEKYFLRKHGTADEIDPNSPIPDVTDRKGLIKFKNYKWVFYGISNTKSRYSDLGKTRVAYLLNPIQSSPILAAIKYSLPVKLREVHAFDDRAKEIIKQKLQLSLLATPKTPTLKEKLFKKQGGNCSLCGKEINYDKLHFNTAHIHHINPISIGGQKFALKNLALTHLWCHREHKH